MSCMTIKRSPRASPGATLDAHRVGPRGISIHALARPYRRVFGNARRLERAGAVRVEPGAPGGRPESLAFAAPREPILVPDHLTDLERRLLGAFASRLAAESSRFDRFVLFAAGRPAPLRRTLDRERVALWTRRY